MTNLKNEKNIVLSEIKYFAMLGYAIEDVNFKDDTVRMVRTTFNKHPFAYAKLKNTLHVITIDTDRPMSKTTTHLNKTVAEKPISFGYYEDYLREHSTQAGINQYENLKAELGKLKDREFDFKSQLVYNHLSAVSPQFRKQLQEHLESIRDILMNAEICDETYLSKEINGLNEKKEQTKQSSSNALTR